MARPPKTDWKLFRQGVWILRRKHATLQVFRMDDNPAHGWKWGCHRTNGELTGQGVCLLLRDAKEAAVKHLGDVSAP